MIIEAIQVMNHDTKREGGGGCFVVLQILLPSSVMALAHKCGCICTGTLTHVQSFGWNETHALTNHIFVSHFKLLVLKHPVVHETTKDASSLDYL
jgi:hypothetical protein